MGMKRDILQVHFSDELTRFIFPYVRDACQSPIPRSEHKRVAHS
jgi:hypothetical protein